MNSISESPGSTTKQNSSAKTVIGCATLLFLLCLFGFLPDMIARLNPPASVTPGQLEGSPSIVPMTPEQLSSVTSTGLEQSVPMTPTNQAADSIVVVTWTPGTASTSAPTRTPLPSELPTRSLETPTTVILPTLTLTGLALRGNLVIILGVDKKLEYAEIKNLGGAPINLRGWKLVSEKGDQSCPLSGILQPNAVLRVWAGAEDVGFTCGFSRDIWSDNELDPAVLYNAQGEEVDRYPR